MDECTECTKNSTKMDENNRHRNTSTLIITRRSHHHYSNKLIIILIVLFTSLIPLTLATATCMHHEYWDSNLDSCIPCTKCNQHQIVFRPCQRHLDTVCKLINSVDFDWNKSLAMATEKAALRREHHHRMMSLSDEEEEASREQELLLWDWQLITLILAIIACLLFFIVTAIISINYVRQWRQIKKEFDTDIEQLSQQLMSRLAVPPSESATIFIDDPSTRNCRLGPRQIEVRCVYLDDILAGKESLKDQQENSLKVSNSPAGNVYIRDNEKRHIIVGQQKTTLK